MDRGGLAGIVAQHTEDPQPRAAGPADRRTHIERIKGTELIEMTLDQIGQLQKHQLALIGFELAPRTLRTPFGGRHGAVDVLGIALGHRGEQFAGRRIAAFKMFARGGVQPFAVDQHLLERAVGEGVTGYRNGFCLRRVCLGHVCLCHVCLLP